MEEFHRFTGYLLIGFNALAGVWCLAAFRWRQLQSRVMWGFVIVAQALTFLQATTGAVLSRRTDTQLGDLHALYGFSAIVAVMIMYGYRTSPFLKDKQLILYGLGSLFVMGLGIRNLYLH